MSQFRGIGRAWLPAVVMLILLGWTPTWRPAAMAPAHPTKELPPVGSATPAPPLPPALPLETPDMLASGALAGPKFGVVEGFRDTPHFLDSGLSWQRITFLWSGLQPSGPQDWNIHYMPDGVLNEQLASGREVLGLLQTAPAWATEHGAPCDPPLGLYAPLGDPANLWATYVDRVVRLYAGRVNTWIVWNEPDIWDPAFPFRTWCGSLEDYYQLLKVTYVVAKEANPRSTVTLAGLTWWWDEMYGQEQFFDRLLKLMEADPSAPEHHFYFDAAVLQLYSDPQLLFDAPSYFKETMAAHGMDKPVWVNETNAVPWDDPASPLTRARFRVTQEEQASYLIQAFASAIAAGVERIAVYKMLDDPEYGPGGEPYGIVNYGRVPKPAYRAVQTIARYLSGATRVTWRELDSVVEVAMVTSVGRVSVVWNRSPDPVTVRVNAASPTARLVDRHGSVTPIVAESDGFFLVSLEGATANTVTNLPDTYYVGGAPILVVQSQAAD